MKRLFTIMLCLMLLVSCATKKMPTPDIQEAAFIEHEAEAVVGVETVGDSSEDSFVEEEETVEEAEVVEETDPWAGFVSEQPEQDEFDFIEEDQIVAVEENESDFSLEELGSFVFEAAPEEEVIESEVVDEVVSEVVSEPVEAVEVETVAANPSSTGFESPGRAAENASTASRNQNAEKQLSFTDKLLDFASKAGDFIMKEKLLSAGILAIFIGIISIIVALIKSSDRRDEYDAYGYSKDTEAEEEDAFDEVPVVKAESKKKSKIDLDLSSEDDEFLKNLLGEEN